MVTRGTSDRSVDNRSQTSSLGNEDDSTSSFGDDASDAGSSFSSVGQSEDGSRAGSDSADLQDFRETDKRRRMRSIVEVGTKKNGPNASRSRIFLEDGDDVTTSAMGINIDNPGEVRNFYKIGKELGKGSFGSVTKASVRTTGAMRAVKKVKIPKGRDKDRAVSFIKNEIRINKLMDHPNIVKLFEIFEDDRYLYMVLELCRDGDLDDHIRDTHISELDGAVVMMQVLRAVVYMHMQQVCHRDLKAENLLINMKSFPAKKNKKKNSGRSVFENAIRVSDFGLSCTCDDHQVLKVSCGTSSHKSPQIYQHSYNLQCDIWACGVILYHMLGQEYPFAGENDVEIKQKVLSGKYTWCKDWLNRSGEAMDLVRELLRYDEEKRVTAHDALKHDWFKKQVPKRDLKDPGMAVLERLRGFRKLNKFKRVALSIVVSMLHDENVVLGRELFVQMDQNGDGFVSVSELRESMERLKVRNPSLKGDGEALMKEFTSDEKKATSKALKELRRRGSFKDDAKLPPLTYTEFLAATFDRAKYTTEDVCKTAFLLFDKDGSGNLDATELLDGRLLGELTPQEADQLINELDADGDLQISFEEFMALMIDEKR
eukprot:TRINITY_DN29707_c0_g1_i1.p1 TRINITY_DN29707_c0_g1~~TRINITY_DN29707_c0_g1_i1.p1  ORF type:complete len:682 (-),score=135.39 TRINITY_DN29707_c0_g1_i1:95-1891(-)